MAHENIKISYSNFCLSPRTDEFGSIDHDNNKFYIKSSAGVLNHTYDLSDNISEIKSLSYTGPRNLGLSFSQLGNELPFFTFEYNTSTQGAIKRWKLNSTNSKLNLQSTINLPSHNGAAVIENYETTFDQATSTGTGRIKITTYSGVESGDVLLLGPSGDVDNLYAFEYVNVTSVSGGWVYITCASGVPPKNEYIAGDAISYWKNAYVFSDDGKLYEVNINNGTYSNVDSSGIYSNVQAASWSRDYQAPAFVKETNLLYLNIDNFQIIRSQALRNVENDRSTVIPIYDLIFDNNNIYRLQKKTTLSDDNGVQSTYSWSTYNYQLDQIASYTKSVALYTIQDGIILNDESIIVKVIVRDQFGVGLINRNVKFYDAPDFGYLTPLNGEVTTDANGVASITYTTNYINPEGDPPDVEYITISARADGSSTTTNGSQYVWDDLEVLFYKRFRHDIYLNQKLDSKSIDIYLTQLEDKSINIYLKSLSKFQFPGGHWVGSGAPSDSTKTIIQLEEFTSQDAITQLDNDFEIESAIEQIAEKENDLQLSQLYISRHHSVGNSDTASINQFRFIEDAIPSFWSEKNSINTNIWIRLRPFAFNLNKSSAVFKVREVSQFGDSGYVDVTSLCVISTFDAGGGSLGLDILYNPHNDFHHNSIVYVSIEVYDTAPNPNIILTDYWFKVIPDYKSPYIINESPSREEEDVSIDTNISFDVLDAGVGVDIDSLELYINNRYKVPSISSIPGGYHVEYTTTEKFNYGQTVSVSVNVTDLSDAHNVLHDLWRFYCDGSEGPWIDTSSIYPKNCSKGIKRNFTGISENVYAVNDTGLDKDSILVTIGGKERNVLITPIIYRLD